MLITAVMSTVCISRPELAEAAASREVPDCKPEKEEFAKVRDANSEAILHACNTFGMFVVRRSCRACGSEVFIQSWLDVSLSLLSSVLRFAGILPLFLYFFRFFRQGDSDWLPFERVFDSRFLHCYCTSARFCF
jgi:hypothetical protein